jgi:hypothetical protein
MTTTQQPFWSSATIKQEVNKYLTSSSAKWFTALILIDEKTKPEEYGEDDAALVQILKRHESMML